MLRIPTASLPVRSEKGPGDSASGDGLDEHLRAEDLVVELAVAQELFVRAHRGDLAVVQNQDEVGVAHGAYPLGYHDHGAVALAHQPVERGLDRRLRLGVHGRGAVVEDQEPGVYEQRPGYGYALALSPREPDPPLADDGVVALGQRADELVGLRRPCCGFDLLLRRVRAAVGYVVAHGAREEQTKIA